MRVADYEALKNAGDFYFHRNESGTVTGICIRGPKTTVSIPFRSNPHAATFWDWDGNEDAPTIKPSIWLDKNGPNDWHFWFTNGEIIPA